MKNGIPHKTLYVGAGKGLAAEEVLTVAQSKDKGIVFELLSDSKKAYPLLLCSGENNDLYCVHKCHQVEEGKACKHIRGIIAMAEKLLSRKLPRKIHVSLAWLSKEERSVVRDLTPHLLNKKGEFKTISLINA